MQAVLAALHPVGHVVQSNGGATHWPEVHAEPATTQSAGVLHCVKQAVLPGLQTYVVQLVQSNGPVPGPAAGADELF